MKTISVVAPLYNEEAGVAKLADTLSALGARMAPEYEIECVLVDDGSSDRTIAEANRCFAPMPRTILLRHEKNRGPGAAIRTGFAKATGDIICTIDADCTFDPLNIPNMLAEMERQGADIITASPYHPDGGVENVPPWRLLLSRGASVMYRQICTCKIYTYTSFMRAYRREVIENTPFHGDGFAAFTEILLRAASRGYRVAEAPMVLKSRVAGASKMRVFRNIRMHLALMARALWWRISPPAPGTLEKQSV